LQETFKTLKAMKRIYYIDWLRILAIVTVFFFHTSHFFDPMYWHVKNPVKSESVLLFLGFINLWIMPLFFFLSGASGVFGARKPFLSFLKSKTLRLLVPYVMGVLLLIPPQKYVEGLSNHTFAGGFFDFLQTYLSGGMFNYHIGFTPGWIGMIGYHLWFLGHLFLISLLLYPVLKYLDRKGEFILDRLFKITAFKGGAVLFFIPVAIAGILLKKHFPDYTSWCDFTKYAIFFFLGFLCTNNEGLKQSFLKSRFIALGIGLVLTVMYFASFSLKETTFGQLFQNNQVYAYYMFQEAAGALVTWCWIIFIVAMGMKYLNKESKYREPLNEAVLPFYILHQTVLLLIGFVVVQWDWNSWGKFGFIAVSALFTIVVIYTLVIKPFNFSRFIFGMSKKPIDMN
jgi:glucans biosynthesis protein C